MELEYLIGDAVTSFIMGFGAGTYLDKNYGIVKDTARYNKNVQREFGIKHSNSASFLKSTNQNDSTIPLGIGMMHFVKDISLNLSSINSFQYSALSVFSGFAGLKLGQLANRFFRNRIKLSEEELHFLTDFEDESFDYMKTTGDYALSSNSALLSKRDECIDLLVDKRNGRELVERLDYIAGLADLAVPHYQFRSWLDSSDSISFYSLNMSIYNEKNVYAFIKDKDYLKLVKFSFIPVDVDIGSDETFEVTTIDHELVDSFDWNDGSELAYLFDDLFDNSIPNLFSYVVRNDDVDFDEKIYVTKQQYGSLFLERNNFGVKNPAPSLLLNIPDSVRTKYDLGSDAFHLQ